MYPFIGTEAIAAGELTRGQLRWNYTAIHPNVYVAKDVRRFLSTYASAAWLWTGRTGIIAGEAAAGLYGVRGIDPETPIEMIGRRRRERRGVIIREERIDPAEVSTVMNLPVTSPARTALDLGRRLPRSRALAHLDALAGITGVTIDEVLALADTYAGARGVRQARDIVELMDGGAQSARETQVRLILLDAGLPKPKTSLVLADDDWETFVPMGWPDAKVAVVIDDDPDTSECGMVVNAAHDECLQRLGWFRVRVVPRHSPRSILYRVRRALMRRGALYPYNGSLAAGQDIQRGPPRPVPSSDAGIASTSIPES
ncbi:type IV toxin-antitoxin system AbiEi family antitoxin [Mycolicibacterium smegmatis]|nr:type IV toxin-antitoxin system AbiEi family antitoxin [Mycolicibacterium smegmatis]AFP41740.1 hypothetical protein MSMEI_5298 [Mycolicibacterium smegmatis MC2 155]AIU10467.1 hypothetical protein LJ00_26925 [Mycolicibacterium smegmatis MC2 155]AIU17092.1 hypothetical protein LI99_26930 [Mycolicibacterium smegmatis]AIU23715.1 hypothetical protein LI98_26935 [Mycolicibacterium smegmatis]MBE9617450.1 hypothetical protein [Mycolicibacterium smegmatis]